MRVVHSAKICEGGGKTEEQRQGCKGADLGVLSKNIYTDNLQHIFEGLQQHS